MQEPITALRQILSIIKPGGHLVLAVPNPARPAIVLINLFRKHYVNRGHLQAWDPSHWRNFLERIMGLDVIEYAGDFVDLLPSEIESRRTTRLTDRAGSDGEPAWLPDGRLVYVAWTGTESELRWLDPENPGVSIVIPVPGERPRNPAAVPHPE